MYTLTKQLAEDGRIGRNILPQFKQTHKAHKLHLYGNNNYYLSYHMRQVAIEMVVGRMSMN